MKQPKLRTDIKFFIAMRITETLGTAADAMSMTFKQLLWHDDDGDIVVDFEERSINVFNPKHDEEIIEALSMICDTYDFELNIHNCQCSNCKAARNQHN